MSTEDDIETLITDMNACLNQATSLKLEFAVHLIRMTLIELSDRSLDCSIKTMERRKEARPPLLS